VAVVSHVLALDTATPATVVGLLGPDGRGRAWTEAPAAGERPAHARRLLPLALEALAGEGVAAADVDRIVVGAGPGTFTGIRIAVATGRALALALGAEVVGVPTPAALAAAALGGDDPGTGPALPGREPADASPSGATPAAASLDGDAGRSVLVVQDARRRELFLTTATAASLAGGAGGLRPEAVPIADLAGWLAARADPPTSAVGDGAPAHRAVLQAAGIAVPDDPSAHAVDGLALARVGAAAPVPATRDVRPVYVRGADAIPTSRRR